MKPVVQIKDARLFNNRLVGAAIDHPNIPSGAEVFTSKIVKIEGNTVETKNTIYNVLNWLEAPVSFEIGL